MRRFVDIDALCQRVGGTRPVHKSTIYRMKDFPKPLHPTPGISRWDEDEVEAYLARMTEARS